jgi:hypothetical protein
MHLCCAPSGVAESKHRKRGAIKACVSAGATDLCPQCIVARRNRMGTGRDVIGCAGPKRRRNMSADDGVAHRPARPELATNKIPMDSHRENGSVQNDYGPLLTRAATLFPAVLHLHSAAPSIPRGSENGVRASPTRGPLRRVGARRDRTRTRRSSPNQSGFVRVRRHETVRARHTYVKTEDGLGSIHVQCR